MDRKKWIELIGKKSMVKLLEENNLIGVDIESITENDYVLGSAVLRDMLYRELSFSGIGKLMELLREKKGYTDRDCELLRKTANTVLIDGWQSSIEGMIFDILDEENLDYELEKEVGTKVLNYIIGNVINYLVRYLEMAINDEKNKRTRAAYIAGILLLLSERDNMVEKFNYYC